MKPIQDRPLAAISCAGDDGALRVVTLVPDGETQSIKGGFVMTRGGVRNALGVQRSWSPTPHRRGTQHAVARRRSRRWCSGLDSIYELRARIGIDGCG